MKLDKLCLVIFFLSVNSILLTAQSEVALNPVSFSQYYNAFEILNPAHAGANHSFKVNSGNKKLIGNYSKIATYYLSANLRVANKKARKKLPFNVLGIYLYNDSEGKYLNRSRFYINYAWHSYITRKLKFSGGFYFGGLNYSVKGTELSSGGSDMIPDGSVGISFYNSDFHLGVSYNQFFNNQIQPIREIGILKPFVNITAKYLWNFSSDYALITQAALKLPDKSKFFSVDLSASVQWKDKLSFVSGVHNRNKLIHSIELSNILNSERKLNLSITYGYPLFNKLGTRFFEIGLGFTID